MLRALRERVERERIRRTGADELPSRLKDFLLGVRTTYDTRPESRAEWDAASGDEG
jgi:hypothetical protein